MGSASPLFHAGPSTRFRAIDNGERHETWVMAPDSQMLCRVLWRKGRRGQASEKVKVPAPHFDNLGEWPTVSYPSTE